MTASQKEAQRRNGRNWHRCLNLQDHVRPGEQDPPPPIQATSTSGSSTPLLCVVKDDAISGMASLSLNSRPEAQASRNAERRGGNRDRQLQRRLAMDTDTQVTVREGNTAVHVTRRSDMTEDQQLPQRLKTRMRRRAKRLG